jgi:hypothetical protein
MKRSVVHTDKVPPAGLVAGARVEIEAIAACTPEKS